MSNNQVREIRFHCEEFEKIAKLSDEELLRYLKGLCKNTKGGIFPKGFRPVRQDVIRQPNQVTLMLAFSGGEAYSVCFVPGPGYHRPS